jgi:Icc-related predicted phosphoesterase
VAISSHIHEARGVDELGNTKLINAGRFPEGYCGVVSIIGDNVKAKIVNLL